MQSHYAYRGSNIISARALIDPFDSVRRCAGERNESPREIETRVRAFLRIIRQLGAVHVFSFVRKKSRISPRCLIADPVLLRSLSFLSVTSRREIMKLHVIRGPSRGDERLYSCGTSFVQRVRTQKSCWLFKRENSPSLNIVPSHLRQLFFSSGREISSRTRFARLVFRIFTFSTSSSNLTLTVPS